MPVKNKDLTHDRLPYRYKAMIPFPEVNFHPEYKQLAAIVGKAKLGVDNWDAWARLQNLFGWKIVILAAEMCDPLKRWPPECEANCLRIKKEQSDRLAEVAVVKEVKKRMDPAVFAEIRKKHGL